MSLIARPTLREVVEELGQEGLLPADGADAARQRVETALRRTDAPSPWFVRGLVGMGAWVASLLFVTFLGILEVLKKPGGTLTAAVLAIVAALFLRRRAIGPFGLQLALALSLGGEVLLVMGIAQRSHSKAWEAMLPLIALEVLYFTLYRDVTRRFLCAVAAPVALLVMLLDHKVPHAYSVLTLTLALASAFLWLEQAQLASGWLGRGHAPAALGLTLVSLGMLLGSLVFHSHKSSDEARLLTTTGWPMAAALCLGTLALEVRIAAERGVAATRPIVLLGLLATVMLGAISHGTPGVMAALATLLLGFHRRNPTLMTMAVLFLLTFASGFYYNLSMTLLAKSGVLCLGGALMLAGYAVISRRERAEASP
jgi:hypothetical protein